MENSCVLCGAVLPHPVVVTQLCSNCNQPGGYTGVCPPCGRAYHLALPYSRCSLCLTDAERAMVGLVQ